ncbi:MAG: PTS sugar transporter subunit IIA, partial [Acetivibrio ethanolgignens]
FVMKKHYKFAESAVDWKEAIRMSCEPLELDGTVDAGYKEALVHCVEEYGPYIVIMPKVAMPHSQEGAKGVHKTAISFMKLDKPVSFEPGNPEMDAQLFFTLASCNSSEHLNNMSRLSEMLMNEELIEQLLEAESEEDLLRLQKEYLG